MQPFTVLTGPAAPLLTANIDTDVIIRVERMVSGDRAALGRYAFEALRYRPDGSDDPAFVLNDPRFRGAPILVAGPNFGCGSSREAAVWALLGLGLRCVVAESFGDIFTANCFQNGLLPVRLAEAEVLRLAEAAGDGAPVTVDLVAETVMSPAGVLCFDIDPARRGAMLEGLDDIGRTLKRMPAARAWQAADRELRPWIWDLP